MKKFLLGFFFATNKLDIVNNQHINIAIFFLYTFNAVIAQSPYNVARELFRRNILWFYLPLELCDKLIANSLDEMCFPESHSAINKERIIFFSRRFRDRGRCGERKLV